MTVRQSDSHVFYIEGHACQAPSLAPGLYVTSTPIGNLGDITVRALQVLASADLVLCEDTRITRKLMQKYGIVVQLQAYHDHNAGRVRPQILKKLSCDGAIALVSDAGSPLVSDPGYKLVAEAVAQGSTVTAIPGASAVLAGLTLSGLPSDRFLFAGFPPAKKGQRTTFFEELRDIRATLIFFHSARGIETVLEELEAVFGDRPAVIARELTKLHEEVLRGSLSELRGAVAGRAALKGEVTLLVGGRRETGAPDAADLDRAILEALQSASLRDVAADIAAAYGLPRRTVYERALELSKAKPGGD